MRTAVLIHGCHLQADLNGKTWHEIVWGCTPGRLPNLAGRATMGLYLAMKLKAKLVIFSTGASEIDGVREGEYTLRSAIAQKAVLGDVLDGMFNREWDVPMVDEILSSRVNVDVESQNTADECERNLRLAALHDIDHVVLVSSPWHIERCHAEALKAAERMRANHEVVPMMIMAVASHGSTEGIVIFEPPHRGDRPKTRWHTILRNVFHIPEERRVGAQQAIAHIIETCCS